MRSYSGRSRQRDEVAEGGACDGPGDGRDVVGRPGSQRAAVPGPRRPPQPAARAAADTESTDEQRSLLTKASEWSDWPFC